MTKFPDQPYRSGPASPGLHRSLRPLRAVRRLDGRGGEVRARRSQRHGARHGRSRRACPMCAWSCSRPMGRRLRLLHQQRKRQGALSSPPNLKAALLLYWKSLHRQVRIRGPVEMVSEADADAYFATRSRESRIGAWASQQSRPLAEPGGARGGGRHAIRQSLPAGTWRGRPIGRATGWCRSRSSSGIAVRTGCTTASCSGGPHAGAPFVKTRLYP